MDHAKSNAIYEVIENRATGERWLVRWEEGSLTGTSDITGEPIPDTPDLPLQRYSKPEKGDAPRLKREGTTWIVLRRFTRFMSAVPPQWVLDRQARTHRDTTQPTEM